MGHTRARRASCSSASSAESVGDWGRFGRFREAERGVERERGACTPGVLRHEQDPEWGSRRVARRGVARPVGKRRMGTRVAFVDAAGHAAPGRLASLEEGFLGRRRAGALSPAGACFAVSCIMPRIAELYSAPETAAGRPAPPPVAPSIPTPERRVALGTGDSGRGGQYPRQLHDLSLP